MDKWEIIINDFDLNERIGKHNEPKLIRQNILEFVDKDKTIKEYKKLINKYMKKSYDFKGYSEGAIKFYYEEKSNDILTLILVHCNGEEVKEGIFD